MIKQPYSYLKVKDANIIEVSGSFLDMTQYSEGVFLNHTFAEVGKMLFKSAFTSIPTAPGQGVPDIFLFANHGKIRQGSLSVKETAPGETLFEFFEKPHSHLEDKFIFLQRLLEDNIMGIAIYTAPEFMLLTGNQKYLEFIRSSHVTAQDFIGMKIQDFVEGWEDSPAKPIWENLVQTGETFYMAEYPCDDRYWEFTMTPILEEAQVKYVVVMLKDVTESIHYRKRMEEQSKIITQQKEQLEAILENMSDALFIFNENREFILLNKSVREYAHIYEINSEEFGSTLKIYNMDGREVPLEDLPVTRVIRGERISQRYKVIYEKNSEKRQYYFNISGTPIFDDQNHFSMGVLCCHDVTKHVENEEVIKSQRDYFYGIIDSLDLPIFRISYPDLRLVEFNKKAYEEMPNLDQYICKDKDLLKPNTPMSDIFRHFYSGENKECIDLAVRTKEIVYRQRAMLLSQSGKPTYYNFIYQPLLDTPDNVKEILVVCINITYEVEQKESLEKLLKMKDEFFSIVSHEFRTPLTVINAAIQTMELVCKEELSDKAKKFIGKIRQNTLRQLRLVNNLLDVTRIEGGYMNIRKKNMDIISVTCAITESVNLYARQKNIELSFESQMPTHILAVDDEKYERILLNLLSNAIKFSPEGGAVSVRIYSEAGHICIALRDEGIGIPPEKQCLIFDRFAQVDSSLTRKAEGSGIGLHLVKLLTSALGGKITLESEAGKGSTFTVHLPDVCIEEDEVAITLGGKDGSLIQTLAIEFSDIYFG